LNQPKRIKGNKQTLEHPKMNKFTKTHEEGSPKVDEMSKEFLASLDIFRTFVVQ
jgi:hypothetical protein